MRNMELKVFKSWIVVSDTERADLILAASSQRKAFDALQSVGLDISIRTIAQFWGFTDDENECAIALASPGEVFISPFEAGKYERMPKRELVKLPKAPKIPTDPEERKRYDAARRGNSDDAKRLRGERRLTTWLPKEAAEALDKLTGGSTERGAVQAALVLALTTCAAQQGTKAV